MKKGEAIREGIESKEGKGGIESKEGRESYPTGVVIEQGNVTALANAIMQMRDKPLSSNDCRKRAEELFDKDKCFEKYVELYEDLLGAR